MIEKIILMLLGGIIGFVSSVGRIWFERRRTGAINSTRILSTFLFEQLNTLKTEDTDIATEIVKQIEGQLQTPNSLGSEAQLAVLISKIHTYKPLDIGKLKELDKALNALDQRATDRDRK